MATDTNRPMTDADILPPADDAAEANAPLKTAGDVEPADSPATTINSGGDDAQGKLAGARQAARDGASKLGQQATDKVRLYAEEGKARAGGALDQLSQMLTDAATQVDERLGAQYGDYARQAAGSVDTFSSSVKAKDLDVLLEDARGFVRKSPGVAIGVAAAVGFALARLVQAGIEDAGKLGTDPDAPKSTRTGA